MWRRLQHWFWALVERGFAHFAEWLETRSDQADAVSSYAWTRRYELEADRSPHADEFKTVWDGEFLFRGEYNYAAELERRLRDETLTEAAARGHTVNMPLIENLTVRTEKYG